MASRRRDEPKITLGMTLWAAFAAVAGTRPDRLAVVADDGELTAAGLAREAAALSARLTDAGVEPGRHVLMMLPNSARYAATLFAVTRAGAIAVPLDPGLSQRELAQIRLGDHAGRGGDRDGAGGRRSRRPGPRHPGDRLPPPVGDPGR